MIHLRTPVIRGSAPGNWRTDVLPFTRWPDAPRYCACGTRLRRTKPPSERLCDPCDDTRQRWFREHGV